MLGYVNYLPYISTVRLRDMKKLVKEIEKLGRLLVFKWCEDGMDNDSAQEAVLVVLKEFLRPNDNSTFTKENLNECILTLNNLLDE